MLSIKRRIPDESSFPISEITAGSDSPNFTCRVELPSAPLEHPIHVAIGGTFPGAHPMDVEEAEEAIAMLEIAVAEVERRGG